VQFGVLFLFAGTIARALAPRQRATVTNESRAPAHHLNHIPVIGIPTGAALLIYGLLRRSEEVKRVSLLVFVVVAIITLPTYLAGKAAEDMVEHLAGVDDDLIHVTKRLRPSD
jgi:hypothetical protein